MIECILPYMKEADKVRRALLLFDEWKACLPVMGNIPKNKQQLNAVCWSGFLKGLPGFDVVSELQITCNNIVRFERVSQPVAA